MQYHVGQLIKCNGNVAIITGVLSEVHGSVEYTVEVGPDDQYCTVFEQDIRILYPDDLREFIRDTVVGTPTPEPSDESA